MYPYIITYKGICTIERLFTENNNSPKQYPTTSFIELLRLGVHNNMFIFGETYWIQTKGTETGKNSTVWYPNFVMIFNKTHTLIPKFQKKFTLLLCLVCDQFGVVSPYQEKVQCNHHNKNIYKYYT